MNPPATIQIARLTLWESVLGCEKLNGSLNNIQAKRRDTKKGLHLLEVDAGSSYRKSGKAQLEPTADEV